MKIFNLAGSLRCSWKRLIIFLVVCSLTVSLASAGGVSAYYTQGALGRSLGVSPGFSVNSNFMAPLGSLCRSGQTLLDFVGVTIHETSNWSSGATAAMHAQYLRGSAQNLEVSWHYSVDSTSAYQSIPENEKAWHAGDTGMGTGNAHTIAIEICDNAGGNFDQAMGNAEWLAADILYRHGVYSVSKHLFQHHDFSSFGKNCPITIRDTGRWPEFSAKTQMYLDQMVAAYGTIQITDSNGEISICGTPPTGNTLSRVDIYDETNRCVGSAPLADGQFKFSLESALFTVGWHIFRFAEMGVNASVSWQTYTYLVGPASKMYVDDPVSDKISYGDVTVSGWAVSHAGISRVDIYMDNMIWLGYTANMFARYDVNDTVNSQGRYKNALLSGFSYTIDAKRLPEGKHILKIAAISNDGTEQWFGRTITVGPKAQLCLDQPGAGDIGGDVTVSGWTVSLSGIKKVDVFVDDGKLVGSTSDMQIRYDVDSIVNSENQYKDGLFSGFTCTVDAGLLTPGAHMLEVEATSKDGSVISVEREFSVGPVSQSCLEYPDTQTYAGDIAITGWAVSHAGIERVDIYADNNQWLDSVSNMSQRSDVETAVNKSGNYKDALHSGFSYTIKDGVLSAGTHVLRIAVISKDGTVQWLVRTVSVQ